MFDFNASGLPREEEFGRLRAHYVEQDPHFTAYVVGLVALDLHYAHLYIEGVEEGRFSPSRLPFIALDARGTQTSQIYL